MTVYTEDIVCNYTSEVCNIWSRVLCYFMLNIK